jgi:hypothetical protein
MATIYAEDFLNKERSTKMSMTDVSRGTLTGGSIGAVGGILYAYFKKAKYGKSIIIGALAGGLISRIFLIKK